MGAGSSVTLHRALTVASNNTHRFIQTDSRLLVESELTRFHGKAANDVTHTILLKLDFRITYFEQAVYGFVDQMLV